MRHFIKEITHPDLLSIKKFMGWGCGYAIIEKGHPVYGNNINDIEIDVHGGLTFGKFGKDINHHTFTEFNIKDDDYIIGFDTAHLLDGPHLDKNFVEQETLRMVEQLNKMI